MIIQVNNIVIKIQADSPQASVRMTKEWACRTHIIYTLLCLTTCGIITVNIIDILNDEYMTLSLVEIAIKVVIFIVDIYITYTFVGIFRFYIRRQAEKRLHTPFQRRPVLNISSVHSTISSPTEENNN